MRSPLTALAAIALLLVLAASGSGLLARSTIAFAAGTNVSFAPVADAYVYETNATTNYGNATTLRVDGSPLMRSYLRFNVQGLSGTVTSATLRLYANSTSPAVLNASGLSDNTWDEGTLTFANAPSAGNLINPSGAVTAASWTTVDVTSYIAGNGSINLVLSANSSTQVSLASREDTAHAPELVIITDATAATATPTAIPTATATPAPSSTATDVPTATATSTDASNNKKPTPTDTPTTAPSNTATAVPTTAATSTATSVPTTAPTSTATNPPPPTSTPTKTSTPVQGADPVIAAAGDIACAPSDGNYKSGLGTASACRMKYTSDILASSNLAGVLTLGDNQYENGELANFNSSYGASWGRVKALTHPAVGNHEYGTSGASGYYNYFGAAAGDPAKGYYSYDIGAWHLVAINSNCSPAGGCGTGSPQEKWLRADLAAHATACTLAYWHHPRFSSGEHGNNSGLQAIWQALYDNGADVVLNGHDHDYERFAPQSPTGVADSARGIREFIVGTGGKSHYGFINVQPNSEVRNSGTYGVLKLTLHASSYNWQFVPEAGATFTDSGSQGCH